MTEKPRVPINVLGVGRLKRFKNTLVYEGSVPSDGKHDDRVIIVRDSDLIEALQQGSANLLQTKIAMPKEFYEIQQETGTRFLMDCMISPDLTPLYLQRYLYSFNFNDNIWVQWRSVDSALRTEPLRRK